jgi:hypothetical protein
MSQRNVEILLGRLLTDEELRRSFARAPLETLTEFSEQGNRRPRRNRRAPLVARRREAPVPPAALQPPRPRHGGHQRQHPLVPSYLRTQQPGSLKASARTAQHRRHTARPSAVTVLESPLESDVVHFRNT